MVLAGEGVYMTMQVILSLPWTLFGPLAFYVSVGFKFLYLRSTSFLFLESASFLLLWSASFPFLYFYNFLFLSTWNLPPNSFAY